MTVTRSNTVHFIIVFLLLLAAALFKTTWSPAGDVPMKKSFDSFPAKIDIWQGKNQPLSDKVLDVLGLTDYIMRDYIPSSGEKDGAMSLPVNLYVGYYSSQSKGKTYHSPKNCLPGGGWELTEIIPVDLIVAGEKHVINSVLIQKGLEKQLVLYWFQDRGRVISSEYAAKIYLFLDTVMKKRSDGTFVRIMAPVRNSIEETLKEEILFAKAIYPLLKEHLPE